MTTNILNYQVRHKIIKLEAQLDGVQEIHFMLNANPCGDAKLKRILEQKIDSISLELRKLKQAHNLE